MPKISLMITIIRPLKMPAISPDTAAAAVAFVVESMAMGDENVAHLITYEDGAFDCASGRIGRHTPQPTGPTAPTPREGD
jgi:hypothetical protein